MPQAPRGAARSMEKLHWEASMLRAACLSAALLACAPALAQNYAGTYTAKNASGGTVMLTLAQDAQSGVSGTLTGYGSKQPASAGARRGRRPARYRGQQLRHPLPDGSSRRRGAEHRAHRARPGWKAEPAARERAAPRESPGQDRSPQRAAERGAYPERLVQLHLQHQRQSQHGAPGLHAQRLGQADARQAGALARAERDAGVLPRWHQLVAAAAAACAQR